MGYERLFAIIANLRGPVKIRALSTCSGIEETKLMFILLRNQEALGLIFEKDGYVRTEEMEYGCNA